MFICYCVTLQELSLITHCKADDFWWNLDKYCYSRSERKNASFGLKVGSCQLTFSVVVFFVALASSIYCCKAVCCGVPPLGSVSNILCFSFDFHFLLFVTLPNLRESKAVLDSEFHALHAGLQVLDPSLCQGKSDFVFQIVGGIPDSLSCILDFKAQDSGFHKQNLSQISDSTS